MRIIAGEKARFPLLPPRDRTTRPITDRVKESLFSIIQAEIPHAVVADLFCGTGSLGLEALSRGARYAVFLDRDRDAIRRLQKNIDKCQFHDRATVHHADVYQHVLPPLPFDIAHTAGSNNAYDLVFLDPPYPHSRATSLDSPLGRLLVNLADLLPHRTLLVTRHNKKNPYLDTYATLHTCDRRVYGDMALTFLENRRDPDE